MLVAGATGGVGKAVVERLAAEGVPVRALVRDGVKGVRTHALLLCCCCVCCTPAALPPLVPPCVPTRRAWCCAHPPRCGDFRCGMPLQPAPPCAASWPAGPSPAFPGLLAIRPT